MADGDSKAIELKGIVHNLTKVGMQDGMCEDLVNLRFKDGSWRPAGDGKHVFSLTDSLGHTYTQLYIHTNVYRHLLGVYDNKLWWIANLTAKEDCESLDDADFKFESLETPKELADVTGNVSITQTGHMLTIISNDSFKYTLYKPIDNLYNPIKLMDGYEASATDNFPFVGLKFGIKKSKSYGHEFENNDKSLAEAVTIALGNASDDNHFVGEMIAIAAIELYDGSYSFSSTPIYIRYSANYTISHVDDEYRASFNSYDLCFRLRDKSVIVENKDIISAVCIFVTPSSTAYNLDLSEYDEEEKEEGETASLKEKTTTERIDHLMHQNFFLLKRYDIEELPENETFLSVDLSGELDEGIVNSITSQDILPADAFGKSTIRPDASYSYNGRLHLANYTKIPYPGYPIFDLCFQNRQVTSQQMSGGISELIDYSSSNASETFYVEVPSGTDPIGSQVGNVLGYTFVEIETEQGIQTVMSYIPRTILNPIQELRYTSELTPLVTYPDYRARKMTIVLFAADYDDSKQHVYYYEFELKRHTYYNFSYYFKTLTRLSAKKIYSDNDDLGGILNENIPEANFQAEYYPNGLKVSKTDNPIVFESASTYQVGSAEIVALCSNAIAVGTGQTGAAPLYVFCKDGVYALMVDQSGEMAYSNARVIARDVCNNAKSVTPIDSGVVFTTDRGLMMIAGEQVQEIGQPLEGDLVAWYDETDDVDYSKIAYNAYTMSKLGNLLVGSIAKKLFLEYLKGSIVNYNHNERELMISNPDYKYTYVMDRNGQWSRRDYTADEFVNNYPTSYRVEEGEFYQVDKNCDADNSVFAMSNVIKLDTLGFKELNRLVARGYFETASAKTEQLTVDAVSSSGYKTRVLYASDGTGIVKQLGSSISVTATNDAAIHTADEIIATYADGTTKSSGTSGGETPRVLELTDVDNIETIELKIYSTTGVYTYDVSSPFDSHLGIYAFGSYDGRKWACLGHKEKTGKFTDIGTLVERTDCKFFRFILAGQLAEDSRLDYFEVSSKTSKLSTKIR